ncbi:hypothetical protein [Streptomyces sp. DH12]|uniref:hypothetical protein n=1 Tax=Streptomyces sp. DH12 TaxID=2857010 RepID=UPI001E5CCA55|nr:hypothetical protein [Streptomyces sp. DH12]
MDHQHLSAPACAQISGGRRLIAAGYVRRPIEPRTTPTIRETAAQVAQQGGASRRATGRDASAAELRTLLSAVRDAIAIPYAATIGDDEIRARIIADRVMHAQIALDNVLDRGDEPGWSADYLRARLAEHPTSSYRHSEAGR